MTDAPVIVLFDADGVAQSSPADVWDRLGALLPEQVEQGPRVRPACPGGGRSGRADGSSAAGAGA